MKKIMTGVLGMVVVSLMLVMPVAAEQGAGPGGPDKKGWEERRVKMNQELGLNPEQQAKMKAFHDENRTKMEALRTKMKADRKALREALDADVLDQGRIAQLTAEVNKSFSEMTSMRTQMAVFARETLTPEQFKKMKERRAAHRKEMGEKGGKYKGKFRKGPGGDRDDDDPSMPPDEGTAGR